MSLLTKGATRLSGLDIDVDKDWLWFPIRNVGYPPEGLPPDEEEGYAANAGWVREWLSNLFGTFLLMDCHLNTVYRNDTDFHQLIVVSYTAGVQVLSDTELLGTSLLYVQLGETSPPVSSIANGGVNVWLRNFAVAAAQTVEVQGGITFVVPPGWYWRLQQQRTGDGMDVAFSVKVLSPVDSGYPPAGG